MRKFLATSALVLATVSLPVGAQVAYIGTSSDAKPGDVAVVLWKLGEQPGSNLRLTVTEISPEASFNRGGLPGYDPMKSTMQSNTAAVIVPGKYVIVAYCIYTLRDVRGEALLEAEAGQKYVVDCEGTTARTAKLRVQPLGS